MNIKKRMTIKGTTLGAIIIALLTSCGTFSNRIEDELSSKTEQYGLGINTEVANRNLRKLDSIINLEVKKITIFDSSVSEFPDQIDSIFNEKIKLMNKPLKKLPQNKY